jgi:hypothetical protein
MKRAATVRLRFGVAAPRVAAGRVTVRLRFRFATATPDTLRPYGLAWLRHA